MRGFTQNKRMALLFVGIFAILGATLLIITKAASPSLSIEAESGTLSGTASLVNDSTASDGKAIQFGAAVSTSGNLHTCFPGRLLYAQ
jgi:hypothetical protein